MRLPFYEVPSANWLFQKSSEARVTPEEQVRQWCAFELIRAYGIRVSDLSFEEEVRVGSKIYRIDILVRRNGIPWIVIECKQAKHSKHAEALDQAISYAGAINIAAEYAVYTNGTVWNVKRLLEGQWNDAADIPVVGPARPVGSIDELLLTLEMVSPLLHKLDEPISGRNARLYLEALQRFFGGGNLLTSGIDHELRFAADLVLRVLSTGPSNEPYCWGKLGKAAELVEGFRTKTGIGYPIAQTDREDSVFIFMSLLSSSLLPLLEAGREVGGLNQDTVRLITALLNYGRSQAAKDYPEFPAYLHTALRSFLTKALALGLDVELPDALSEHLTSDYKQYTRQSWNALISNERTYHQESGRYLLMGVLRRLNPRHWFSRKEPF